MNMKKLLGILLVCVLSSYTGYGQALHIDSTRFITGNKGYTQIGMAIPTRDKGILFIGEVYGNPGGIIPFISFDTGVNGNVMIGKIDSNQQISWIKVYGGSHEDGGVSVCQTADGGYAVLCNTASNDHDITGYKGGGNDIWLLRLNGTGNLLWEKTYGGPAQDGAISIANSPDNGFIILGSSNGSGGDVPFHYGDMWTFDWLVIKTDSTGNVQWSKDIGGTGEEGIGVILPIDNSYYLISHSNSTDHDCTDTVWHAGVNTSLDCYVLKLNDTGKVLWDSSYGGSGEDGVFAALYDSNDSTIIMVGGTNSSDYMVTGYQGQGDMWVVKVNLDGKLLWQKTLGSPYADVATSVCMAHDSGYVVYGGTNGVYGGGDGWIGIIDNNGNERCHKVFGGTDNELLSSVVPYLNGYVATGTSQSRSFVEGSTYGNFDTSAANPNGGGVFVTYFDTGLHEGIQQFYPSEKSLVLFPNPATYNLNLSNVNTGKLTIIDEMGSLIYEQIKKGGLFNLTVDVNNWSNGVYLVRWIDTEGNCMTSKFIKM